MMRDAHEDAMSTMQKVHKKLSESYKSRIEGLELSEQEAAERIKDLVARCSDIEAERHRLAAELHIWTSKEVADKPDRTFQEPLQELVSEYALGQPNVNPDDLTKLMCDLFQNFQAVVQRAINGVREQARDGGETRIEFESACDPIEGSS